MQRVSNSVKEKSRLTRDEWREYTKTVWRIANTTHAEHPAVFPVEIPHRLIKLFSWHGETVLDPFAGIGTTAEAAVPLGRKALCVDQNRKYTDIIRRDCGHLKNGHLTAADLMDVVHGDSRDLSFVENDSLLMPGDPGHAVMSALTESLESVGRGASRVIADGAAIREAWAGCPLVTAIEPPPAPGN